MNATLFDGGKVHWLSGLAARCGVGKSRQRRAWQMDLGEVTCQRCAKFLRKATLSKGAISTTDDTDERG